MEKKVELSDVIKAVKDGVPKDEILKMMDNVEGYHHIHIIPDEKYVVDGKFITALLDIIASLHKKKWYKFW